MKKILAILKQADKKMHLVASYAISLTLFLVGLMLNFKGWAIPFAVVLACLVGYGKELGDKYCWRGSYEANDLIADACGIVLAVIPMMLLLIV